MTACLWLTLHPQFLHQKRKQSWINCLQSLWNMLLYTSEKGLRACIWYLLTITTNDSQDLSSRHSPDSFRLFHISPKSSLKGFKVTFLWDPHWPNSASASHLISLTLQKHNDCPPGRGMRCDFLDAQNRLQWLRRCWVFGLAAVMDVPPAPNQFWSQDWGAYLRLWCT